MHSCWNWVRLCSFWNVFVYLFKPWAFKATFGILLRYSVNLGDCSKSSNIVENFSLDVLCYWNGWNCNDVASYYGSKKKVKWKKSSGKTSTIIKWKKWNCCSSSIEKKFTRWSWGAFVEISLFLIDLLDLSGNRPFNSLRFIFDQRKLQNIC